MGKRIGLRQWVALKLFKKLHKIRTEEHQLTTLFWECTLRCNLNCRHCGSDCKKTAHTPDMPKEDFLRVLDSVAAKTDPHKVFVVVTGGEPLMRNDLEECGRAIYERGFPWGMVTNGLFLTRERLDALMAAGLHTATYLTLMQSSFSSMGSAAMRMKITVAAAWIRSMGRPDT